MLNQEAAQRRRRVALISKTIEHVLEVGAGRARCGGRGRRRAALSSLLQSGNIIGGCTPLAPCLTVREGEDREQDERREENIAIRQSKTGAAVSDDSCGAEPFRIWAEYSFSSMALLVNQTPSKIGLFSSAQFGSSAKRTLVGLV
jgi:hypothetical protein